MPTQSVSTRKDSPALRFVSTFRRPEIRISWMSTADRTRASCIPSIPADQQQAINRLMGLAVFGDMVAARTYTLMGQLKPEFTDLMRKFAGMEGQHAAWFRDASRANGIEPDKEFADGELD